MTSMVKPRPSYAEAVAFHHADAGQPYQMQLPDDALMLCAWKAKMIQEQDRHGEGHDGGVV